MAARRPEEVHHAAPRCLVSLHERANRNGELDGEAIQAWLEWEMEAMRWRVPIEISKEDLEALVGPRGRCWSGRSTGCSTRATGGGGAQGAAGKR